MNKHKPTDPIKSPRFSGIKTFMRLPHIKKLDGVDFAIIGVPSDAGASFRTGQREGPAAIRKVSALLRHHNPVLNISPFEYLSSILFSKHLRFILYEVFHINDLNQLACF